MDCWSLDLSVPFDEIAGWCLATRNVDRLLVSTRFDQSSDPPRLLAPSVHARIHQVFEGVILKELETSGWPGTELIGHSGRVYIIAFNEEIMRRMAAEQNDLSKWTQWNDPPLPEDICLFRQGELLPNLVSITHEGEAWIISDPPVNLKGAEKTALNPDDLLIPRGEYFVRE